MNIKTRKELKEILEYEWQRYFGNGGKRAYARRRFHRTVTYQIWCYHRLLRICEYLIAKGSFMSKIRYHFTERRRNKLGGRLCLEIPTNVFDIGLCIYHCNVTVAPDCRIGRDCDLRGNNCLGNNNGVPVIGDRASIGNGATIIGGVTLGDDVTVGSGAVVTKSFGSGVTVVGVPAREL